MFCPKCGKDNVDGSEFCQSCGASFAVCTGRGSAPVSGTQSPAYQGTPYQRRLVGQRAPHPELPGLVDHLGLHVLADGIAAIIERHSGGQPGGPRRHRRCTGGLAQGQACGDADHLDGDLCGVHNHRHHRRGGAASGGQP